MKEGYDASFDRARREPRDADTRLINGVQFCSFSFMDLRRCS